VGVPTLSLTKIVGLVKEFFPDIIKGGLTYYINDLRDKYQAGAVDAEYLETIARLLEEGAKTIRQMYGATGDRFMDEVRRKAKTEIKEVDEGERRNDLPQM